LHKIYPKDPNYGSDQSFHSKPVLALLANLTSFKMHRMWCNSLLVRYTVYYDKHITFKNSLDLIGKVG